MRVEIRRAEFREIEPMRDIYRLEMSCQIIHDSIPSRPGWTDEYLGPVDIRVEQFSVLR
jgi:hypothetical protein